MSVASFVAELSGEKQLSLHLHKLKDKYPFLIN